MLKKTYVIQVDQNELEKFDPNIELIVSDIKREKRRHEEKFDYDVRIVINGFLENGNVNASLNAFLHDTFTENSELGNMLKKPDATEYLKAFITGLFTPAYDYANKHQMDAVHMEYFGFSFVFDLPKSYISKEKYDEYIALGADHLFSALSNSLDLARYFCPYMYMTLAERELMDKPNMRKLSCYRAGLH